MKLKMNDLPQLHSDLVLYYCYKMPSKSGSSLLRLYKEGVKWVKVLIILIIKVFDENLGKVRMFDQIEFCIRVNAIKTVRSTFKSSWVDSFWEHKTAADAAILTQIMWNRFVAYKKYCSSSCRALSQVVVFVVWKSLEYFRVTTIQNQMKL